jgi:hypothetical protein
MSPAGSFTRPRTSTINLPKNNCRQCTNVVDIGQICYEATKPQIILAAIRSRITPITSLT